MKTKNIRNLLLVGTAVLILFLIFGLASKPSTPASRNGVFSFLAPPFVSVANAASSPAVSQIENEAGISAYFKSPTTINLNSVASLFRTIESQTATYIIGSIAVPNYPETEDVHVYIHVDGWVLAYYLKADPSGKIFDWKAYTGGTNIPTKLENVLSIVASQIGAPSPTPTYYDFRYPNATHLMLIAERVGDGDDSFQVNLPGSFAYYERSWAMSHVNGYFIDGVNISGYPAEICGTYQGNLSAVQLSPDAFHTIAGTLPCYGSYNIGLALVYRVP